MLTAGIRLVAVIAAICPYTLSVAQYQRFAFDEMYDILFAHLNFESDLCALQEILPAARNRFIADVVSA